MAKVIVDRGLMNLPSSRPTAGMSRRSWTRSTPTTCCGRPRPAASPPDLIEEAALTYARARAAAILYSTGVEARGAEAIQAIVNLALLTGNIGKEGGRHAALAEHNNLQGVCDMGMLPDRLPGYRLADERRARGLESALGRQAAREPRADLAARSSRTGVRAGALWLCRHDPVCAGSSAEAAAAWRSWSWWWSSTCS